MLIGVAAWSISVNVCNIKTIKVKLALDRWFIISFWLQQELKESRLCACACDIMPKNSGSVDCLKAWDSLTKLEKVTEIKRPQHTLSGGLGRELEGSWKGAY